VTDPCACFLGIGCEIACIGIGDGEEDDGIKISPVAVE